jgi:hypothetical protein
MAEVGNKASILLKNDEEVLTIVREARMGMTWMPIWDCGVRVKTSESLWVVVLAFHAFYNGRGTEHNSIVRPMHV